MAALQERNGSYRVIFNYRGKQWAFTLGRVAESEAEAKASQVNYLLMRLKQGLITLPPGTDVVAFFQHDGAPPAKAAASPAPRSEPTIADLRDRYLETHANGSLEIHTIRGIRRHFGHLVRHFGESFPIRTMTLADLQGYADKRAKAKGRRGKLLPVTIKKEIVTLSIAWNWGARMDLVAGRCPVDGLRYAKGDEKPPFQSRAEIERQLPGLPLGKADELWEALYLTASEVEQLLAYIKAHAAHPWIYPLLTTAAHTGARRAELLRMRVADLDLSMGVVSIRERKRVHGRRTTRRVPLSTTLAMVLAEWLKIHPGGPLLFVQPEVVGRSRKRSTKTGYKGKDRPTTQKARQAGVQQRARTGILPLTENEACHHLNQTLVGSTWEVVRVLVHREMEKPGSGDKVEYA
jgi:integrase